MFLFFPVRKLAEQVFVESALEEAEPNAAHD
jgi:hypothetical protein